MKPLKITDINEFKATCFFEKFDDGVSIKTDERWDTDTRKIRISKINW